MPDSPEVRPAIADDTPGIQSLVASAYAEYNIVLDLAGEDAHLVNPGPYFRSHGGEFWVMEQGNAIQATCAVLIKDDSAELKALYVHQDLRRQGIGARLTQLAIDYARSHGSAKIVLWSDVLFLDAHRLYRKMGFTQRGRRELHDLNETCEYGFEMVL